ncbi:MAG: hypothetical protein ACP5N3_06620 [Candidatus Nanoarchaeia archaeon]
MKKVLLSLFVSLQMYAVQAQVMPEYKKTRQEIEYEISTKYGVDSTEINFEILPEDYWYRVLAIYSPWCDSLKLNYYEIMRSAERNSESFDSLLTKTMRQEFGHYRADKLNEEMGLKSAMEERYMRDLLQVYLNMLFENEKEPGKYNYMIEKFVDMKYEDLSTILLDKLVNEGIGLYYENPKLEPLAASWPLSVGQY